MTRKTDAPDPARLAKNVEYALRNAFSADDLLPMVETLARVAEKGSPTWAFAQQKLAELLVERDPWRAAIAARACCRLCPDEHAAHGLLALALTMLGHYRAAERAYRDALRIAPDEPRYAHNLGHMLDMALGRPREAVPLLRRAFRREPHVEIAASLAHALGRTGRAAEGLTILRRALTGDTPSRDQAALLDWLSSMSPSK